MSTATRPARRAAYIGLALAAALAVGAGAGVALVGDDEGSGGATGPAAGSDRQAEVAARGSEVMPFDLDATTHRFAEDADGGVQTVVADDPADSGQISEIRRHLREEADAFARGDMSDPASIHGADMPGLATLEERAATLEVGYADRPDGGAIRYTSADPVTIDALHAWFDAQVADHGSHAEHAG